ncbi:hypothetical protein TorRG33x02_072050 [Trema orientale]|uniref:Uncharacterized protein n=1 Tax=Trema orientale TaxID=63057 RepID=A0A2P5FGD8_TREOI|nr:hypothetical protein TorRG33x02_072050 [Trema orientale]
MAMAMSDHRLREVVVVWFNNVTESNNSSHFIRLPIRKRWSKLLFPKKKVCLLPMSIIVSTMQKLQKAEVLIQIRKRSPKVSEQLSPSILYDEQRILGGSGFIEQHRWT